MDRRRRSRTVQHVDPPPYEYEEESESEEEEEEDDDDDEEEEEDEEEEATTATLSSPLRGEFRGDAAKRGRGSQDGVGMAPVGEDSERGEGWNREEAEGLFCPICFEAWSNGGEHYPSCLPCGHLYGMSCIKKWFGLRRSRNKCPQCNTKCTMKDVRRIYGSRVLVHDDELQKRIQSLEAKCDFLEKKDADWRRKEAEWLRREADWLKKEADLHMQLHREKTKNLGRLSDHKGVLWSSAGDQGSQEQRTGCNNESTFRSSDSYHGFVLQREVQVNGARFFDVDAAGQTLIIARKALGVGGRHAITKMSLINPRDQEDIILPVNLKVVKDMCMSPFARLALTASLGKKLSVISLESNNVVLNYDLPVPAWSCSWDLKSSHYVYAGLQNGMLLVFDTRNTARPLESRNGLTGNPIHTICSLSTDSTGPSSMGKLLTASSVGVCHWSIGFGTDNFRPSMLPDTENQGVCVSLAYCSASDYLVATYRPKVEMTSELAVSQPFLTPSSVTGQSVQGSHVFLKRMRSCYAKLGSTFANVPTIRLPKYAIMDMKNGASLAYADEITSELVLQGLPSLAIADRLKSYYPIRDIKYNSALHASSLICLSKDTLQFFSQKLC